MPPLAKREVVERGLFDDPIKDNQPNKIPLMWRLCRKCGIEKQLCDFTKNAACSYGRLNTCKKCSSRTVMKYQKKHPQEKRALDKRYLDKKSKILEYNLKWRLQGTIKRAREQGYAPCTSSVEELLPVFTTVCQICAQENGTEIYLDHCHITGKFRGFLCRRCNTVLGSCNDDTRLLEAMITYLKRNRDAKTSKA